MYDSCHICFWPIFFASFPISASQLTASPLRRRNAISLGCVSTVNTLTFVLTHWNKCLNLCSWIEWRAHLCFTPIDSSLYFQKVYQAGKLLPDDMEGWHSERNCTCVRKKRIACWRAKTWVPSQMHSLPSTKSHAHSLFPKKITVLQIRYAGLSDPLQSAASHARHGNQSSCPRWRASTCRKLLHTIVPISTWIDLTWPNWLSTRAARLVVFIKMLLDLLGNVGASRVYTFHVVRNRIPRVHWNSRKTWKNLLHHAIMPFLENHTIRQPLQSWFEVPSQPSVQKAEVFFSLPF